MKRVATRYLATVAIVTGLALGTPAVALAGTVTPNSSSSVATTSTTTTIAPVTTLKEYRVALKVYQLELKSINQAFIAAVASAKATYASEIVVAKNAAQRITARAALRLAIAEATVTRASALTALGNPPVKPKSHRAALSGA